MKRKIVCIVTALCMLLCFTGCLDEFLNDSSSSSSSTSDNKKEDSKKGNPKYEVTNQSLFWSENSISGNWDYYYVYEIKNTGDTKLHLNDLESNITVNGESKTVFSCPSIIGPGETGYFFNMDEDLGRGVDASGGVSVTPNLKIEETSASSSVFKATNVKMRIHDTDCVTVTGQIKNDSDSDTGFFNLFCLYLDASGKVIAITDESISNIEAHTTYEINSGGLFSHRGETTSKIKSVKVIASAPYSKI